MTSQISRSVNLVPLTCLDIELQMKVRELRNEEGIRKWAYTDHTIDVDEHRAWLNRVTTDDRQIVFIVFNDQRTTPLGIVSVNAINRQHKRADWAYSLASGSRGGLGSAIEYSFISFIFDSLGIQKLNCEVISGNDTVIKLHKKFLFKEEGFRRSNIIKNGERIGVHLLGITKEEWDAGKLEIRQKYTGALDRFSVSIQWSS